MDVARMELAKNLLFPIISDVFRIVIYYAELTEMEKLLIIFDENVHNKEYFDTYEVELADGQNRCRCEYEYMWFLINTLGSDEEEYRVRFEFGNSCELYHFQQVELEDLLPSRNLNIYITSTDPYITRILDGCRDQYLRKMQWLMDEV